MTVIGATLVADKTIHYLVQSGSHIALTLVSLAAIAIFFYAIIRFTFEKTISIEYDHLAISRKIAFWKVLPPVFLLAWSPYLIATFPGSTCPDMTSMLMQYMGYSDFSTHHPLQSTFYTVASFLSEKRLEAAIPLA